MFQDNLKALRKQKGYTQESLAIQLHVVRQTVSKWEKGLSVPDAELLQRIAEVLEVDVVQLLGGELPKREPDQSALVEQLARINEQLAIRNRRARRIWRTAIIALVAAPLLLLALTIALRAAYVDRDPAGSVAWRCALNGEEYGWEIEYNAKYQILAGGGDAWIGNHLDLQQYDEDANQYAAHLQDYFTERGGTVEVTRTEGLKLLGD